MSEDTASKAVIGPLDIGRVMAALPHRYPMLLVDRVEELVIDERITAIKADLRKPAPPLKGGSPSTGAGWNRERCSATAA